MKKIMLLFSLILASAPAFAKCSSSGIYFWPSGTTVQENTIFSIEGYMNSQSLITKLGKNYDVYLKSATDKIALHVQEICAGQLSITQAILKPERNLIAGQEYTIVISNKDLREQETEDIASYTKSWTVAEGKDDILPAWKSKPVFKKNDFEMYGCGPAASSIFSFSASESSAFLVRTTVKNVETGTESVYYLNPYENQISIGHGMCSGAFVIEGGGKYEVEFSLLDASGNVTAWVA